jgi:hypothetical protein
VVAPAPYFCPELAIRHLSNYRRIIEISPGHLERASGIEPPSDPWQGLQAVLGLSSRNSVLVDSTLRNRLHGTAWADTHYRPLSPRVGPNLAQIPKPDLTELKRAGAGSRLGARAPCYANLSPMYPAVSVTYESACTWSSALSQLQRLAKSRFSPYNSTKRLNIKSRYMKS